MSAVLAIGEQVRLAGYQLAGVELRVADDATAARAAWEGLAEDVACVILTPASRASLGERLAERPEVVWAVVPG
jgi:vacuolar-type H+-ATPase subunit F/Vma7